MIQQPRLVTEVCGIVMKEAYGVCACVGICTFDVKLEASPPHAQRHAGIIICAREGSMGHIDGNRTLFYVY